MATKKGNVHGRFYGLLNSMPGANKEELIWQYSNMLTTSLSEFYDKNPNGYKQMISAMQRMVSESNQETKTAYIIDRELKNRRSAILHRLQKMGIDTTNWDVVNKFMRNPRIAGKTLGEMDTDEMDLLIPKLEAIAIKKKAEAARLAYLAQNN